MLGGKLDVKEKEKEYRLKRNETFSALNVTKNLHITLSFTVGAFDELLSAPAFTASISLLSRNESWLIPLDPDNLWGPILIFDLELHKIVFQEAHAIDPRAVHSVQVRVFSRE
jgi:hypothetical protein